MTPTPLVLLCGLAVALPVTARAQAVDAPALPAPSPVIGGPSSPTGTETPASPDGGVPALPGSAAPAPQAGIPPVSPQTTPAASPSAGAGKSAAKPLPATTGALRNGSAPSAATQPNGAARPGASTTITYGGPQQDLQPIYGSPMRDPGTGRNGTPVYSNDPSRPGGPINGTANAYLPTQPYGTSRTRAGTQASRGGASDGESTYNLKPLGGVPNTRDQSGSFGGRAGYNASGVYNGTAAQTGTGYGSPYAPAGRPQGGLLSTNVDATGPLRPYMPLNQSPNGRPNSGYGVPNGSRATHMDGRGVQRIDR